MPSNKKLLQAAAGNAGESLYVEDVFSTYLYDGDSSNPITINNGIDFAGEGGLFWNRDRNTGYTGSVLLDTERGTLQTLATEQTSGNVSISSNKNVTYNNNGITIQAASSTSTGVLNFSNYSLCSWSFRKAEKFFDIVNFTGNGTTQSISHNLGSTPGVIIVKNTQSSTYWAVYHGSIPAYVGFLNATNAFDTSNTQNFGNNTNPVAPTDSVFTVGQQSTVNSSGDTYVAYLFASDAGGFGDDGSENIIKCGSYVGTGSATVPNHVELGFEPQYWLIKNTTRAADWWCIDTMRGATYSGTARLFPNTSGAEVAAGLNVVPTATGFDLYNNNDSHNRSGDTYIYIAIRRPMKTPESGTDVFSPSTYAGNDPTPTVITTGFPVDLALTAYRDLANAGAFGFTPRLTEAYLYSATTAAEVATGFAFDSNTSFATDANAWNQSPSNLIGYGFKRATGFMDAVAYTGDKVLGRTVDHNLKVSPELIIIKRRTGQADQWSVGHTDLGWLTRISLNSSNAAQSSNNVYWNSTAPTSTQFTIGSLGSMNETGESFISYLFATLAGVSKVGSYTGTGSDLNVDCGFSAGARFILIKRTDSTGDWYTYDSARGIVAGNDPYLLLNSTAAEVTNTDYIDPLSSGFTVTSSAPAGLNASGGSYIFLAIA
ncbi:hypothetical protein OAU05_00545 [bacterium]|nr:hypothetical protein [bacterium]